MEPTLDSNLGSPAQNLRDNSERARVALIVAYILLGVTLISAVSTYMEYELFDRFLKGEQITMSEAQSNQTREASISICNMIMNIGFVVVFIMWFRRAYFNLGQMGVKTQYTEGWAAGAWFVPFVNLVRPYTIMREIWENYRYKAAERDMNAVNNAGTGTLGVWWAVWLIGNILTNISVRMGFDEENVSKLQTADMIGLVAGGLDLISLLILIQIIRKVSSWEKILTGNQNF